MKFEVTNPGVTNYSHVPAAVRCPHCRREAVLENLGPHDFGIPNTDFVCGQRRCPNANCHGHVFVVLRAGIVVAAYPPVKLDFDPEGIPADIVATLEEAITCHANECFVASAIMVRRVLEEVCADRGATGKDLKDRLRDLRSRIVLPEELLDAADELRVLGNDAAHVEAKEYDDISKEEAEIAIAFAIEILKGVYQYASLLTRLRGLKKDQV